MGLNPGTVKLRKLRECPCPERGNWVTVAVELLLRPVKLMWTRHANPDTLPDGALLSYRSSSMLESELAE